MNGFLREFIEYQGVYSFFSEKGQEGQKIQFKRVNLAGELHLPETSKPILKMVTVMIEPPALTSEMVLTKQGKSIEGEEKSGYSVMIMGHMLLKVQYLTEFHEEVYSSQQRVAFGEYINLARGTNPQQLIRPELYIEDIYVKQKGERCLAYHISGMLVMSRKK